MYLAYFTEITLLLNTTPKHIHALSHFCKSLKIPSPQIRILHSQPFTNSHSASFTVESASATRKQVRRGMVTNDIWSRSSQSNDWNNSCVRRALCGVVLPSCTIKPHERCPSLFLLTASRSRGSVSQEAFTLPDLHRGIYSTQMMLSASQNTDTLGEAGCFHRTPACSVLGVKWYTHISTLSLLIKKLVCLLEITKDMKEKSWNVYFCALPSGISVHSVHILCGILVLHGQSCRPIQFRWTNIMNA